MAEETGKKIPGAYIGSEGLVEGKGEPPYFESLAGGARTYGGVDGFQESFPAKRRNRFEVLRSPRDE